MPGHEHQRVLWNDLDGQTIQHATRGCIGFPATLNQSPLVGPRAVPLLERLQYDNPVVPVDLQDGLLLLCLSQLGVSDQNTRPYGCHLDTIRPSSVAVT